MDHPHTALRGYLGCPLNWGRVTRSVHRYALTHGFAGGFPNWEQSLDGSGKLVYGIILLRPQLAERRVVRATELKYAGNEVGERYRSARRYAEANGFTSGFPDWEQGLDGNGELVYGIILVRSSTTERRVVSELALRMFTALSFDPAIAPGDMRRLLERHCFAITRLTTCSSLQPAEKQRLIQAYRKNIRHGISTNPEANAEAFVGGAELDVNFGNLFPLGNDEIAQTLIHEMMHCAGYDHPDRRPTDIPFDGGPYYDTPPLRAELCIAGRQSLTADESPRENCRRVDGKFIYHVG